MSPRPTNKEVQAKLRAERVKLPKLPPKPRGGKRPGAGGVRKVPIDAIFAHVDLDAAELLRLDSGRSMIQPKRPSRRQFIRDCFAAAIANGWVDVEKALEPPVRSGRTPVGVQVARGVYAEIQAVALRLKTSQQEVMRAAIRVAVDEIFLGDRRAVRKKLREDAAKKGKA